jgi:hypothetical protein
MDPEAVLADSVVEVSAESYAVVTADSDVPGAFATIDDGRETTHVVPETHLSDVETIDATRGWTLFTFDVVLPFELVGFLAVVAAALAEAEIPVFVLSAYSTDHILVRHRHAASAAETLSDLGCEVREP